MAQIEVQLSMAERLNAQQDEIIDTAFSDIDAALKTSRKLTAKILAIESSLIRAAHIDHVTDWHLNKAKQVTDIINTLKNIEKQIKV